MCVHDVNKSTKDFKNGIPNKLQQLNKVILARDNVSNKENYFYFLPVFVQDVAERQHYELSNCKIAKSNFGFFSCKYVFFGVSLAKKDDWQMLNEL